MIYAPPYLTSHNCLETQVWSTIRYVKVSCKFVNPPRHGSYGRLEEDKRVCLKTSSICHPPRSWPQHLFEILAKTAEKRDVIDVVHLSCDVPLMLNACSPLRGSTVPFTTLLTQCKPYFRPIPTVLPSTFTNPSLPHSPEAPQLHLN